ncbi:DUF6443 domain-containing protein [Hymenobacter sp. 5414T-23]|uniref:DUF6443 domain-containing protein n=1 Tax=Hymenobacter sp. 5414T-23 TaxID=2932252 RepID=UPI001FD1E645|nr:DUF6443 domain-containing protein [Hymenobacter sp. 5414T-23]UOQ83301.1 DUF6443 domain-containing protein [Hymenobacter sp. 5414T-23]
MITGQNGAQLTASQAGSYTVRIPGTGPSYESRPVEVLDPLTDQTVNDQALSFVNSIRVLQRSVTSVDQLQALSPASRSQEITYVNGLGQPLQQIAVQAGPAQQDILQHMAYTGSATSAQSYLPLPATASTNGPGTYEADPLSKLSSYYTPKGGQPYATTIIEASPLGRPVEQTTPGTAWAGHSTKISYQTNGDQEVRQWRGDDGTQWYTAGQLRKEVLTDADNRQTEVFKDLLDRVVLQRKLTGSGATRKTYDTYTVYAEAGYVQRVIPPAAVEAMAAAGQWNLQVMQSQQASFKEKWLYEYTYDNRGRLVERQFPGAAPVYLVYDAFDRPVLVQDGNHREAKQWLFTKFDAQNRPVVEGLYSRDLSREALQREADDATQTAEFETRVNDGYTTTATFPAVQEGSTGMLLSLTFYDDYDVDQNGQPDYTAQAAGTEPMPSVTEQLRGLTTVTRRRVVQPNGQFGPWLTTALFYDEYGNLVQKQSNNLLQAGTALTDVTTQVYREQGFVPQVVRSVKTQQTGIEPPVVVRNRYRYDAAGRLLQTWQQHQYKGQWEPEVLLASNQYTGLGELTQKKLHSRNGGTSFLQTEDFVYDLHGQLTSINQSNLVNNPENDLFGMTLFREQAASNGNTPRFDGGISAVRWSAFNPDQTNQPQRESGYVYAYDGLGRLKDAIYAARTNSGTAWDKEVGAYDEKNITYDANGNITALQRYTQALPTSGRVLMDDLSLSYSGTGNRLNKADEVTGDITRGFKDVKMATEYGYDANGSVTRDENKGVSYSYNTLNKVERQTVGSSSINYTYDAAGTVLKKEVIKSTGTTTEYYVDGVVYEVSPTLTGLRSVPTPEGRALVKTSGATQLTYEYHMRDHLGNLRVAFRAEQNQVERKLAWENQEAPFSGFENATPSRVSGPSYHGPNGPSNPSAYSAAVTAATPGPFTRIPVVHGAPVKVSLWYSTPNGEQFLQGVEQSVTTLQRVAPVMAVAPSLVPIVNQTSRENAPSKQRVAPGLQVSVSGLLSGFWLQQQAKKSQPPIAVNAMLTEKPAFVEWRLYDENNQFLRKGEAPAPVLAGGGWDKLRFSITPDLSEKESRTGYLEVQLVNTGNMPVYYDSLTVRYSQDKVSVSQENHYYPFGMNMSGVAVNTAPVVDLSKKQFNDGSSLQDELLGAEGGVYSTFFRTYDPTIGRFTGVDPLADVTSDWTPYHFALGNPTSINDPTGALSDGDISFLYSLLDAVNNSRSGITGLFLSFGGDSGGGGGGMFDFFGNNEGVIFGFRNGSFGFYSQSGSYTSGAYRNSDGMNIGQIGTRAEFHKLSSNATNQEKGLVSRTEWGIVSNIVGGVGVLTGINSGTEDAILYSNIQKLEKLGFNATEALKQLSMDGKALPQAMKNIKFVGNEVSTLSKMAKFARPIGVVGGVIGTGMSLVKIVSGNGTAIDYLDVGVGGASLGAAIFLASNPVGWAIGGAATLYFGGRIVYDMVNQ